MFNEISQKLNKITCVEQRLINMCQSKNIEMQMPAGFRIFEDIKNQCGKT